MLDAATSAPTSRISPTEIPAAEGAQGFSMPPAAAQEIPADAMGPVLQAAADQVGDARPDLDQVLRDYQVEDDEIVQYTPNLGPYPVDVPFVGSRQMTATEAELLDELGSRRGLLGLHQFAEITSNDRDDPGLAYATADERFPQEDAAGNFVEGGEDGHNDAFRHAYWNALMTSRFGEEFAASFGTAHEGVPGNPAAKEAMDLYNNELGRRIASENPDASDEELADLVFEAVMDGEAVVIDAAGELAFSDQVEVGATGRATGEPAEARITPPKWDSN